VTARQSVTRMSQDEEPKSPEPGEDAAEIVADGGEDDVGGVAGAAFEIAAAEVAFRLQVSDDGLDGGLNVTPPTSSPSKSR
jgi:hypothetical protein